MKSFKNYVIEQKSYFQNLKAGQVKLEPEERKTCMDCKAVWHFKMPGHQATPAVWKSNHGGKTTFVTNTHRAFNTAPTLKGAISKFHSFIKGTA